MEHVIRNISWLNGFYIVLVNIHITILTSMAKLSLPKLSSIFSLGSSEVTEVTLSGLSVVPGKNNSFSGSSLEKLSVKKCCYTVLVRYNYIE